MQAKVKLTGRVTVMSFPLCVCAHIYIRLLKRDSHARVRMSDAVNLIVSAIRRLSCAGDVNFARIKVTGGNFTFSLHK